MTIFTASLAGADGTALNTVSGFLVYGSGTVSAMQLNGSGGVKTDGNGDCPLYGQTYGALEAFVEVTLGNDLTGIDNTDRFRLGVNCDDRNLMNWLVYNPGDVGWDLRATAQGRIGFFSSAAPSVGSLLRLQRRAVSPTIEFYINNTKIFDADQVDVAFAAAFNVGFLCDGWPASAAINPIITTYRSGLVSDLSGGGGSGLLPKLMQY